MAKWIEVDTVQLERDRAAAQQSLAQVRKSLAAIYSGMQELDAMWDGPANEMFRRQFDSDKENFELMFKEMETLIANLAFAKNEYEKCDSQVRETIQAIKV